MPQLPEIGVGGMIVLSIISLLGGILLGIHQPLLMQLGIVVAIGTFVGAGSRDLELGAIPWVFPVFVLIFGCVIGNISWAFQTDAIVLNFESFKNPFLIE